MVDMLQYVSLSFIELAIFMLLWSKFSLKATNNWFKNSFILLIELIILMLTRHLNTYIIVFIIYLSIISLMKFMYKKLFIQTVCEFIVYSCISMILQILIIGCVNLVGFQYSDTFIFNITFLLIELIFIIIILRYNFSEKVKKVLQLESTILYYFVTNLGLYFLLSKFVWEYNKHIILNNFLVYILIVLEIGRASCRERVS